MQGSRVNGLVVVRGVCHRQGCWRFCRKGGCGVELGDEGVWLIDVPIVVVVVVVSRRYVVFFFF